MPPGAPLQSEVASSASHTPFHVRLKWGNSANVNGFHAQSQPEPGAAEGVYFSWAQADGLGVWYRISCRGTQPVDRVQVLGRGQQ